LRAVFI